jgi:hypothetical protein
MKITKHEAMAFVAALFISLGVALDRLFPVLIHLVAR